MTAPAPACAADLPTDAKAVAYIPHPPTAVRALQTLAEAARLKPSLAGPNWLQQRLQQRWPAAGDLSGADPAWLVVNTDRDGLRVRRFAAPDHTQATRPPSAAAHPTRSTPPAGPAAPCFRDVSALMAGSSHVIVHLVLANATDPAAMALRTALGIEQIIFGLTFEADGLDIKVQLPRPTSRQRPPSTLNVTRPLITGLPNLPYGAVFGERPHPRVRHALSYAALTGAYTADEMRSGQSALRPSPRRAKRFALFGPKVRRLLHALQRQCRTVSVGAVVPNNDLDPPYALATGRCRRARRLGQQGFDVARRRSRAGDLLSVKVLKPRRRDALHRLRLDSELLLTPLDLWPATVQFGATGPQHLVATWNAPAEALAALLSRKTRARATMKGTHARIMTPRVAEGYAWPDRLAAAWLPSALVAVMGFTSDAPPVGYAAQIQPDGAIVSQVWVPLTWVHALGLLIQL